MNKPDSLYIGLMSGTSLDGIDAVLASIDQNGLARPLDSISTPFSPELRQALIDLQTPGKNEIHRENQAANALALAYADAVKALLHEAKLQPDCITGIGAHGQTIRHRADLPHQLAYTHQTLNPALLAEETGIDVIADFRSRDLAAGGHGAPLVPAFHAQQFLSPAENRAVLNIGGISNLTLLPTTGEVRGFDCGPGNMLMDAWIADQQGHTFDKDGAWAQQGELHQAVLNRMLADPFFTKLPPKSTGRDDFHMSWLREKIGNENIEPKDVQATLLHLSAQIVLDALAQHAPQTKKLIVCGGGAKNIALMNLLDAKAQILFEHPPTIITSESIGIDPQLVESLAFAWLAWAHQEKRPASLPAVTGAKGPRVLGAYYPA